MSNSDDANSDDAAIPQPGVRIFRIILPLIFVLLISSIIISQTLTFWLNIFEFDTLFIRPFYFELYSGFILASLALIRLDIKNRRSIIWWTIPFGIRLLKEKGFIETVPTEYLDFQNFHLSKTKFILWQVTKVLFGSLFFGNLFFGMALFAIGQGWDPQLSQIGVLFSLPFTTPTFDPSFATQNVVPLMPALTLLITPFLGAIGLRLFVLFGLTQIIKIATPSTTEIVGENRIGWKFATVEVLLGVGLLWSTLNAFFPSMIDYNTKISIIGMGTLGFLFLIFGIIDLKKWKHIKQLTRNLLLTRILPIVIVLLISVSAMGIQDSIADARKVEWRGPYITQQVSMNRYLAELDAVTEIPYEFEASGSMSNSEADLYVTNQTHLLSQIRLWDSVAALSKLTPEIGLRPYIEFEDSDIIRFGDGMYWSSSMSVKIPANAQSSDLWYNEHLHYTHVPDGFLLLNAHEGNVTDPSLFFKQRSIYYGEGGLLEDSWSAYPYDRTESQELTGTFYDGEGGIKVNPPLSWLWDSTFFFSYRDDPIQIMRYRDVFERMDLLFPYFDYSFGQATIDAAGREVQQKLDIFPVTDGEKTLWLMPLIITLDSSNVPFTGGNDFRRLVGYASIDAYTGEIQLIILGTDYFSELFKTAYSEYITTEVPSWLENQTRYPEELFEWRVAMYNYFHVTDPQTFIASREFYEVPIELDTYYIFAQPPGFKQSEFIGLLSLEFANAEAKNLAGYMVVRNDYPQLGDMIFYEVDIESATKLLGPSAVREALEKNSEFRQLSTLLQTPRLGDKILYRIGEHDVYVIPVYTAPGGGVVTEIGAIAVVGASFDGTYNIGLSQTNSINEAFKNYLTQLQGTKRPQTDQLITQLSQTQRIENITNIFINNNISVHEPHQKPATNLVFFEGEIEYTNNNHYNQTETFITEFINDHGDTNRIILWTENDELYLGFVSNVEGVVELRYIHVILD